MDTFGRRNGLLDREMSAATFDLSLNVLSVVFLFLFLLGIFQAIRFGYYIFSFLYVHVIHTSKIARYHRAGAWAIVTGASQGIGTAIAGELAKHGFNVVLHGRNQSKLEAVIARLQQEYPHASFKHAIADAANSHGVKAAIEKIVDDVAKLPGPLTVLVNNVGAMRGVYGDKSPWLALQEQTAQDADCTLDINVRFTMQLTRAVLPLLAKPLAEPGAITGAKKKGEPFLIMNISSIAGYWGSPLLAVYSGSKAFIQRWSEALAQELMMQPMYSAGESICYMVGETTGAGSIDKKVSFAVTDANTLARRSIDKVGCGWLTIAPYWGHAFMMATVIDVLPQWMLILIFRKTIIGHLRRWKKRDVDDAKED